MRVARIAAGTVKAPVAIITLRQNRKLMMLGAHGIYFGKFDESWEMGADLHRRQSMSFVANVAKDPNFTNHPILKAAPFARSLAHVPVQGQHADLEAAITIINPDIKWPFNASVSALLMDLAMLVGDTLKASEFSAPDVEESQAALPPGLNETALPLSVAIESKDTAGQFLLSTLRPRTSIRSRQDVSFVTLRTWSKAIKPYQMSALKIVKKGADQKFVDQVAQEMATHVRSIFGEPRVSGVVPVPCGHSRSVFCLSVRIAQAVARILDVPFMELLQNVERSGSSHPRKNTELTAPVLQDGASVVSLLLVDDVATSGRHIELAVKSLRNRAQHVAAIAWIGAA